MIGTQGVSQVVGTFDGEPTKCRDWIKSIEKYMLLAGGDDNQSKRLAYQASRGAVIGTFKGIWLSTQNDQYVWMLQLPPGGSSVEGPPKLFWPINLKTV